MVSASASPRIRSAQVARSKKQDPEESSKDGKSIAFRAPQDLVERLEHVADGLGLDVSNLVRMVLKENLTPYEDRVRQMQERQGKRSKDA